MSCEAATHGVSIHIAKRVNYRVGQIRAHSVVVGKHLEAQDSGVLVVTDRRAVFIGDREDIGVPSRPARRARAVRRWTAPERVEPSDRILVPVRPGLVAERRCSVALSLVGARFSYRGFRIVTTPESEGAQTDEVLARDVYKRLDAADSARRYENKRSSAVQNKSNSESEDIMSTAVRLGSHVQF